MLAEFKKFILRGNVVDLAVAVVIGGAFTAIVNSLVNHIIMPVIGYLIADINFADLKIILSEAVVENDVIIKPEAAIGLWIADSGDYHIFDRCTGHLLCGQGAEPLEEKRRRETTRTSTDS